MAIKVGVHGQVAFSLVSTCGAKQSWALLTFFFLFLSFLSLSISAELTGSPRELGGSASLMLSRAAMRLHRHRSWTQSGE